MEYYDILFPLALILLLSKILTKICAKYGMPQVVGMLLAGVLIGLIKFIPGQNFLNDTTAIGLGFFAKIGVVLIMFSAGLETDIKQIKAVGFPAVAITIAGVIFPMGFGFLVACLFNGGFHTGADQMLTNLFYGTILTATSVSVSVATLRELGKLSSKTGSTIIAAAIIDDIIGIIVLSFVIALKGNGQETTSGWMVLLKNVLFFVVIAVIALLFSKLFNWIERRYPHHRLLPILSLSLCFAIAYLSENVFGVADITGAFIVGLILSRNKEASYIDRKSDVLGYMIFTPVFFANIGIGSDFNFSGGNLIFFGLCFILAGMAGKVFGCAFFSRLCHYPVRDSLRIGIGMMARAEVALVCAQKGVDAGIIDSNIMPFVVALIIITSFATPILLKMTYKKQSEKPAPPAPTIAVKNGHTGAKPTA